MSTPGAGSISDESGEKVVFNSPETIAAFKWFTDVYNDPKYAKMLPDGIRGWDGGANNENFLGGKIIFTQNASSLYWAAKNQNNPYKDKIPLWQFPVGPKNELMGGYPYYHMTFAKSKNRDASMAIAQYMATTPLVMERTKIASGQAWPMYQNQVDAKEVKDYIGSDKNLEQLFKNCTHSSGWMVGWPSNPTPAINAVSQPEPARQVHGGLCQQEGHGREPGQAVPRPDGRGLQQLRRQAVASLGPLG